MEMMLKLPDAAVTSILTDTRLSGSFDDRLLQIVQGYFNGASDARVVPRHEALKDIKEVIAGMEKRLNFKVSDLMAPYILSAGDRRQLGKEIAALQGELKFSKSPLSNWDYVKD